MIGGYFTMLFSVIIPAYNAEEYLSETLESARMQTFQDFEVVLIDDGSTDATGMIADRFANMFENTVIYHGGNEGLLLARRRGLTMASGDYIIFLDADDCLREDALELLAATIEVTSADIVSYRASREADYSESARSAALLEPGLYKGLRYNLVLEHACKGRFNSLWSKAIRYACFNVDEDYSQYAGLMHNEDLLQLLPIINKAESLVQLDDILYYYRPNKTASTARYKTEQLSDAAIVCHVLLTYAKLWGYACYKNAILGELNQYLYLLKINEMSSATNIAKQEAVQEIRATMKAEGVFERSDGVQLGVGERLLRNSLMRGRFTEFNILIKIAVMVSETKLPYPILAKLRAE